MGSFSSGTELIPSMPESVMLCCREGVDGGALGIVIPDDFGGSICSVFSNRFATQFRNQCNPDCIDIPLASQEHMSHSV